MKELRKEYRLNALDESAMAESPFEQFGIWFNQAVKSGLLEPNAMSLATATKNSQPSLRTVLLKSWSKGGFVFFTNYLSRKGREIADNPQAALLFFWPDLERQIRIEGILAKTPRSVSQEYFSSRPKQAQLAALVSSQSCKLSAGRSELDEAFCAAQKSYADQPVPCPEHWGGYNLEPERFEFWQGRENRLHDRIEYVKSNLVWEKCRLYP